MAVFRCKMCGGDIETEEGASSCTCEFCGTRQTVPKVKNEEIQLLFNRANTLRMKSEFDKAAEVYEKILQSSEKEAEAYWGLILCKYGIEYVEDPKTFKRIPTCHRASYDAVLADEDYQNAIKYADAVQREIYEVEAIQIDKIQKKILNLAQKEMPYDIFICYKETDEFGKRTQDSVIANDIYYQLTGEGFKVFYAAITLEDKIGSEYEPYIFSALNTSKVMLALGTKPEYFSSAWVKNEWSRFLKIMKKDHSKLLIPCYRDMDPYELPKEFAHLQAQDMSKIGFITDLIRGIRKIVGKDTPKQQAQEKIIIQQNASAITASAQVKRGKLALEDQDWSKADDFFEEALNIDPECAEAYIGKLLVGKRLTSWLEYIDMLEKKYEKTDAELLVACTSDVDHVNKKINEYEIEGYLEASVINDLYYYDCSYESVLSNRKRERERQEKELCSERLLIRAQQYAKDETKKQIEEGLARLETIWDERIMQAQKQDNETIAKIKAAYAEHLVDADKKAKKLNEEAIKICEQDYQKAVEKMKRANDVVAFSEAREIFRKLNNYKNSKELVQKCQSRIQCIKEEREKRNRIKATTRRRKQKKVLKIVAILAIIVYMVTTFAMCRKEVLRSSVEKLIEQNKAKSSGEVFKEGESVYFGSYEQDNNSKNGKEKIEWIVLATKPDRVLLISKYVLDWQKYCDSEVEISWKTSTIRTWLNETFKDKAFTSKEQKDIIVLTDSVFLLSQYQEQTYFTSNLKKQCSPTEYASAQSNGKCSVDKKCGWWLREPQKNDNIIAINENGANCSYKDIKTDSCYGVRPVIWVNPIVLSSNK